jgi:hypothetical protein
MLDRAGGLGNVVGTGADDNEFRIGDHIQTRDNTSRLATSDGRRVLNRDVWTVTGSRADGTVIAKHRRRRTTVAITSEYLSMQTVLAYASTIAGAQGRNTDTGHVLVTPRTNAASLYVGMTRGRQSNHAHVVTDGHDHGELDLGHKTGLHGFADAIARQPDGDTSATTVRKQWAADATERAAARKRDRDEAYVGKLWENTKLSFPPVRLAQIADRDDQIIRTLSTAPQSIPASIRRASAGTAWGQPHAGDQFVSLLAKPASSPRPGELAANHQDASLTRD